MFFLRIRDPFLEFLRNLSPQIVLFSICIVLGSKLTPKFDPSNICGSLPFIVVLILFCAAAFANIWKFAESCLISLANVEEEFKKIKKVQSGLKVHVSWLTKQLRQKSRPLFKELAIFLMVIVFSYGCLIVASVQAALQLKHLIQG